MIQNKVVAIILAILTFLLGSIVLTAVIFYLLGYPLSSIGEHQIYVFFAILVSAILASRVYGRGTKERASKVTKIVENSFGISVDEKVVWKILSTIEQIPPFIVNKYVSLDINAVNESEDKIKDYKNNLSEEDLLKIRKIIETPVEQLQDVVNELYLETNLEQFKIMADPKARPLIESNVQELRKVLFDE